MNEVIIYRQEAKLPSKVTDALTGINHLLITRLSKDTDFSKCKIIIIISDSLTAAIYDLCRSLRSSLPNIPIITTSNSRATNDILALFKAGTDFFIYLAQDDQLFQAQLRALLERIGASIPSTISLAGITIDEHKYTVIAHGTEITLRRREFEILKLLAKKPGRVYTRTQINLATRRLCSETNDEAIDVHISNIRKALSKIYPENLITTVYGIGYKLKIS
jgi:DNA-binding response OmpR family regulator